MAKIKRWILNLIAFIFTIFLAIKFVASLFFIYALAQLPLRVCGNLKQLNEGICCETKYKANRKIQGQDIGHVLSDVNIQNCFQSILDSCISLCLTATFLNYNSFLVKFTLMICHHVHHYFLQLIFQDLPDYSQEIEQSYSYFMVWAFVLLGFFGITTQLAFILDLVHVLTLPTKIIYTALRWIYSHLVHKIGKLYQFITLDPTKWITCPYPRKYMTVYYRSTALMLLIILVQLTALTVFYYAWLCTIMVGLVMIQNLLENFSRFFLSLGFLVCQFKGYPRQNAQKKRQKIWQSLLEPQTTIRIIKGADVFLRNKQSPHKNKSKPSTFKLKAVFQAFLNIRNN